MNITFIVPVNDAAWFNRQKSTIGYNAILPVWDSSSAAEALNWGIDNSDANDQIANVAAAIALMPTDGNDPNSAEILAAIEATETEIVVCCHQDVLFPRNWTGRLEKQLALIDDPNFGVIGTFGVDLDFKPVGHVHGTPEKLLKDPMGWFKRGKLPCEVQTLDEHCLILRKSSGLRFDSSLGWHCYGADICLQAATKGMKNYAIDACVYHGGKGLADTKNLKPFLNSLAILQKKWEGKNPYSQIKTTCAKVKL